MNDDQALLDFRDLCLDRHSMEGTSLQPVIGWITPGPTYPQQSYYTNPPRPEIKIRSAIWRILDDDDKPSQWCFAICRDEENEIYRYRTLYAWATFDFHQIPAAIDNWIMSQKPNRSTQMELFA